MYKKALLASLVVGATIGIIVGVAKNKSEEWKIKKEIKDLEQMNAELDKLINETEKLIWFETNHKRVQKGLKPILKLV